MSGRALGWRADVTKGPRVEAGRTTLLVRDRRGVTIGVLHVLNEEVTEARALLSETWMKLCGECRAELEERSDVSARIK